MRYLEKSFKWWVYLAIFLFGVGLAIGLTTPAGLGLPYEYMAGLEELSRFLVPFSPVTAVIIFIKNISAMLISFIFSPVLGLVPILTLTVNGWLIGFISVIVAQKESVWYILAALLPHGVFEIPALIIAQAAALSFGAMTIILILKKESRTILLSTVKKNVSHVLLALVLFFIVGIFHTIIIIALLEKRTRDILMPNLKRNLRYLMIACALLLPAAIIETYVTPLLLP